MSPSTLVLIELTEARCFKIEAIFVRVRGEEKGGKTVDAGFFVGKDKRTIHGLGCRMRSFSGTYQR